MIVVSLSVTFLYKLTIFSFVVQLDPIEQHFSKSDKDITSTVQATHNLKADKYEQKRSLRPRGTQNSISIQSPTGDSIPTSVAQKLSCGM